MNDKRERLASLRLSSSVAASALVTIGNSS
jgi:hypothetical protein